MAAQQVQKAISGYVLWPAPRCSRRCYTVSLMGKRCQLTQRWQASGGAEPRLPTSFSSSHAIRLLIFVRHALTDHAPPVGGWGGERTHATEKLTDLTQSSTSSCCSMLICSNCSPNCLSSNSAAKFTTLSRSQLRHVGPRLTRSRRTSHTCDRASCGCCRHSGVSPARSRDRSTRAAPPSLRCRLRRSSRSHFFVITARDADPRLPR